MVKAKKQTKQPTFAEGKQRRQWLKQVELFADAIEASANNPTPHINVSATFLTDPKDIAKFMEKRKKANAGNE